MNDIESWIDQNIRPTQQRFKVHNSSSGMTCESGMPFQCLEKTKSWFRLIPDLCPVFCWSPAWCLGSSYYYIGGFHSRSLVKERELRVPGHTEGQLSYRKRTILQRRSFTIWRSQTIPRHDLRDSKHASSHHIPTLHPRMLASHDPTVPYISFRWRF